MSTITCPRCELDSADVPLFLCRVLPPAPAQAFHELLQERYPDHDPVACHCCCLDCPGWTQDEEMISDEEIRQIIPGHDDRSGKPFPGLRCLFPACRAVSSPDHEDIPAPAICQCPSQLDRELSAVTAPEEVVAHMRGPGESQVLKVAQQVIKLLPGLQFLLSDMRAVIPVGLQRIERHRVSLSLRFLLHDTRFMT